MIMKYCPNYHCVAYGRVVYTQTTRCVFCRWDLKPPRMKSETADDPAPSIESTTAWPGPADAPSEESRERPRRPALRPGA
jgi:hypothetical protein